MAGSPHPSLQIVRAYWEALRDGALPPFHRQVEARGLEAALSHTFTLRRIDARTTRFHAVGQAVAAMIVVRPLADTPVAALFAAEARPRAADLAEAVFAGPAILEMDLVAQEAARGHRLAARLHLLPLRDPAGRTTEAMGCLVPLDGADPRPTAFAIAGSRVMPLQTGAAVPAGTLRAVTGFAEPPAPFAAKARTGGRPHLRLVHTRD